MIACFTGALDSLVTGIWAGGGGSYAISLQSSEFTAYNLTVAVEGPPPSAPIGTVCGAGSDCASGYCVDGVCCDQACSGVCETCGDGTCTPVPLGQDPQSECAPFCCDGGGACLTSCETSSECANGFFCNTSAQCVAPKGDGAACLTNEECTNGSCVNGLCGGACPSDKEDTSIWPRRRKSIVGSSKSE